VANQDGPLNYNEGAPEPPDSWLQSLLEAFVIVKSIEAGGLVKLSETRVQAALEKARKWYPNGVHAHYERKFGDIQVELVDASRCDRSGEHDQETTGRWDEQSSYDPGVGTDLREIDPDTGEETGKTLTQRDLHQVNHAQHVLLAVALHRLGVDAIEVTREEYERATGLDTNPMGALMISRKGDTYTVANVTSPKAGRA
jgi:hypothetical protein